MNDMIELQSNLDKIERTVFRKYLYDVKKQFTVYPFNSFNLYNNSEMNETLRFVYDTNIKCFYIERWVFDKKEQIIDRFSNVYSAFSQRTDAIALLVKRTCTGADFYFVVRTDSLSGSNELQTRNTLKLLKEAVKGNFPGTIIKDVKSTFNDDMDIWKMKTKKAVSAITSISSDKSEKHISQGIEKLLNGVVPNEESEEYTIVFLAEPIKHDELLSIKNGYEELASSVYSYGEFQKNIASTDTETEGDSWTSAHTTGTNRSIAKTKGFNIGGNASLNISAGWLKGLFKNIKHTKSTTFGINAGYQYSRTITEGSQTSDTITDGTNHCVSESKTEGATYSFKSYPITDMIKRIEKQIQRLDESEGVGMWKSAAYILADNTIQAENVANFLLGILQGKDSFVEASVINTWSAASTGKGDDFRNILEYIRHFAHPILINIADIAAFEGDANLNVTSSDLETITLANFVTSVELASIMSFPYKSVKGLSCIECAEFERNVLYKNLDVFETENDKKIEHREIDLGQIYHMHEFEKASVKLDIDELTKHTFITGSTGSGKSTTVYKILHELNSKKNNIPFMVIEPAKGEYRLEFNNAKILSTNINHGSLLQINPFYFPANGDNRIFVSEHIDRLVEIFSVCWPMYAAMPAVLKEAIEAAYEESGWDLVTSKNRISQKLFPTFVDLLNQLKMVISNSDFSDEVKSNYTGSLVTRIKSLTNGIYRQIFSSKNTNENDLFMNNVIVDISKVGSTETKALIMGILVMRMQEYHMANSCPVKQLKHITVIEEAHNLLRKTSTEQSSESSNVLGKSVEMISNAIAEMRTYGEGFIIADQAPGLLDESAIRNTNTKIIMSLPDYSDRELVGKSVGLTDEQITEITRLPRGKAVIYQNNWVSPVLCAIEAYKNDNQEGLPSAKNNRLEQKSFVDKQNKLINAVLHNKIDDIKEIEEQFILELNIPVHTKVLLLSHRNSNKRFQKAERIDFIYDFYATDKVKAAIKKSEIKLQTTRNNDVDDLKSEYQHWIDAIGISNELAQNDLRAIINIILYKMQTLEQSKIEKCELLFKISEKWR